MPDPIVIDASAWLAVLLGEEGAHLIEPFLEDRPLLAPEVIRYETANGVLYAKRSNRVAVKRIALSGLLDIIKEFPMQAIPWEIWWDDSVKLVQRYDLSFYDAAYVGSAVALKLPLLTLDAKILTVMRVEHLEPVL